MSDDTLLPEIQAPDPDVAAAELALGLLEGDERATALRRVLAESGFAHSVEIWRAHLAQLFDLWPEMTPSNAVFTRLVQTIDAPSVPNMQPVRRTGLLWPGIAAATSLIAASLLLVVTLRPTPLAPAALPPARAVVAPVPAKMLVAAIAPGETGAAVTAVYDPASGGLRLTEAALVDANQSAELWIIGTDATPHSLGILHVKGGTTLTVTAANRAQIAAGATLAISLEAVGGSATGLPQGPVVAKGTLSLV